VPYLIIAVFGWPAILLSITMTASAIAARRPGLALVGAVLGLPPIWYLFAAAPRYRLFVLGIAGCYLSVGYALRLGHRWLAIMLVVPFITVFSILACAVLHQGR
jgi:hypothetical protein